jgi:hypothetical protein
MSTISNLTAFIDSSSRIASKRIRKLRRVAKWRSDRQEGKMIEAKTSYVLDQIARSGLLLDDDLVAAIFNGTPPPLESIVNELVTRALDAEAVIRGDAGSTWNERRIAIQCLAIAFLTALACPKTEG